MRSVVWLVPVLAVTIAKPAVAQEKAQVGLTMGYPASVGVVWHAVDRVAVRPEFTFTQSTTEVTGILTLSIGNQTQTFETLSTVTGTAVGTGVSALLYVTKRDGLGLYVSPRYTYSHLSAAPSASRAAASTTTSTHGVSGSLGAQYAMGRRFGVFGEVGLMYARGLIETPEIEGGPNSPLPTSQSESRNRSIGLRSGVGIVLYF